MNFRNEKIDKKLGVGGKPEQKKRNFFLVKKFSSIQI